MAGSRLIHVGFGNIVNAGKIIAIVSPDSAPVRRLALLPETIRGRAQSEDDSDDEEDS